MSFLDQVAADIQNVFLNTKEFAEERTVIYDGVTYHIPVTLTRLKQSKTPIPVTSNLDGLRTVSAVAHISLTDLDGKVPEENEWIRIEDGTALGEMYLRRYKVVTSGCAMGMITLELEAIED